MAPTVALVFALLASQVAVVSAQDTPKHAVFASQRLPCEGGGNAAAGSCGCSAIGRTNNASVVNCSAGGPATISNCHGCCGSATFDCLDWQLSGGSCGTGKENDNTKYGNAAGSVLAAQITNCCMDDPKATCSQITCSTRRRNYAGSMIAKAVADAPATTECTSSDDCDTKCCMSNPAMCGPEGQPADCGVNHTSKPMQQRDMSSAWCDMTATAASTVAFTGMGNSSNADYLAKCCDAKATCAATPTCPANYEAMSPMRTSKCSGATCSPMECCSRIATVTMCHDHCTAGTMGNVNGARNAATCSTPWWNICNSTKCDAGQSIDRSNMIAGGATATDAAIKTACCITTPVEYVEPVQSQSQVKTMCTAYFAAVVAVAKGTAGGAYLAGVSMPIMLAVAALLSTKL